MSTESMMTETTATTTEGETASQQANDPSTTGVQDDGQQQQQQTETQSTVEGDGQQQEQQAEKPNKAEGAPEEYTFAMPEGQEIDEGYVNQFAETARELNLPQDTAQQILNKMAPAMVARQAEQIAAAQEQWAQDSRVDKEFGGDHLTENLGIARKAMDQFATPELRTLLNESGMGNHPEVIRMFVRVGKTISEDSFVTGKQSDAQGAGSAKRFYPNSNMN
ncbi:protease [Alcaligenaceae bacterium]|nr:protease [Alcaligenaceae bacterium]